MDEHKPLLDPAHFDSYEGYYGQRLLPGAALLSYAGIGVVVLFLLSDLWRLGLGPAFAWLTTASVAGSLLIVAMARVMHHPAFARHRVHWILWLGNMAMLCMMAGNVLVLGRMSYLPMIIMYFMLGVLLIAPLVSPLAFLLPHLTAICLTGVVMWLDGYHLGHWLQLLLFSVPAMSFMLVILNVQRRTALQSYQLARQNWLYATTDTLSQLQNRRTWYLQAERQLLAAQGAPLPLSLLMLDVDHFKAINDRLGHAAGDQAIEALGELLLASCPSQALAGRLGGEEFAVLLPDCDPQQASLVAEHLRAAIAALPLRLDGQTFRITASIGIASLPADSLDALVREADRQLYLAKAAGRNRVSVADAGLASSMPG